MANYDTLSDSLKNIPRCEFCKYQRDGKCELFFKNKKHPTIDVSYYVTKGGSPDVCPKRH